MDHDSHRRRFEDLERCTALEYILIGDLRDLLEEPPDEETDRWTLVVLDALLETLPEVMALKSADGYMSDVVLECPRCEAEVVRLQQEHEKLYRDLKLFRDQLAQKTRDRITELRVRDGLRRWIDAMTDLHRAEHTLTQMAANLELGAGE